MSELICNELAKSYSHFQLYPTSFQLESGYLTVLAGKNGSGKSTLLRCLAGIDPACTGDVTLDGISLKKEPDSYKDQIGYVSEELTYLWKNPLWKTRASGPLFFQLVHGTLLYADGPDEFFSLQTALAALQRRIHENADLFCTGTSSTFSDLG